MSMETHVAIEEIFKKLPWILFYKSLVLVQVKIPQTSYFSNLQKQHLEAPVWYFRPFPELFLNLYCGDKFLN